MTIKELETLYEGIEKENENASSISEKEKIQKELTQIKKKNSFLVSIVNFVSRMQFFPA